MNLDKKVEYLDLVWGKDALEKTYLILDKVNHNHKLKE